ncbi:hypothetical protein [Streptomyces sp. MAR4 CNX-425]|uniref:hypothetical protein n=1 Tax=Streptomyces sp. MAR4 CNX-425 TaxID=3406343 RepID=UPI003B50D5B6
MPVQRQLPGADDLDVPTGVPAGSVPARSRSQPASAAGDLAAPEGVPAGAVPARGQSRPAPGSSSRSAAQRAGAPQDAGIDLDDLARRLFDPMARLLRTELRRGRERIGRPHDRRR